MEYIKEVIDKNKKKSYIVISVIGILLVVVYIKLFFSYGIRYENTFLKKQSVSSEIHYTGKKVGGKINIIVKELSSNPQEFEISYILGENINKSYILSFGETGFSGEKVTIKDDQPIVRFEGSYEKGNPFLRDKDGMVVFSDVVMVIGDVERAEWPNPISNPHEMIKLVKGEDEGIRGRLSLIMLALFIGVIMMVDISFPLLFFSIKYALSVESPEPTEWYKATQKISWCVMSCFIVILLIMAVW
ncbi:MAG TPA: hypothetical protein GX707_02060 [Epulopiscium sp.]|nr:hypothetical protein [Candidatus Epulonipiscium sp.]